MAEGKNKIIVYADWRENFEDLSDEELGKLMRHFFDYINDLNPVLEDRYLKLAWKPIQSTLKRDLKKWQEHVEKQRINGAKGGRPKKPKKPNGFSENPTKPKKADSDSDSDSDSIYYINKEDFLEDWKKAREGVLKKPTNIKDLTLSEEQNFNQLKNQFTIEEFRSGMIGLFSQTSAYESNKLRPSHFLRDRNIEKYIDCNKNNIQLFNDNKKPVL